MNRKLDSLIALLQNRDVAAMNILQVPVENELEQVGEMAAQVYVPAQADDDRLTYVTPDTEVHSGVFVDEQLGDTIQEVTSPISREKRRVQKREVALQMPYTVGEKPKHRKQEVVYDPTRALDEVRVQGLRSWMDSTKNPNETRQGGTTSMGRQFFRELLDVGTWISNDVSN